MVIEGQQVVLLDEDLQPSGNADKAAVHTADTPLHLAFSLYLFDEKGNVLITRRALSKVTWPGVWSNSCCGHPTPGEEMERAVRRRLGEELAVGVSNLAMVLPRFRYVATDASGIVENEFCPVYIGTIVGSLQPDSAEVVEFAWVPWRSLIEISHQAPELISPWASKQVIQLAQLAEFSLPLAR